MDHGARLSALRDAIDAQRRALIAGDADGLVTQGRAALEHLRAVQADTGARPAQASREIAEAAAQLRLNAQLLARAGSANARALAVLFGSSAPTYDASGAGQPLRRSRAIDAA